MLSTEFLSGDNKLNNFKNRIAGASDLQIPWDNKEKGFWACKCVFCKTFGLPHIHL